jgi:hypothetical protein
MSRWKPQLLAKLANTMAIIGIEIAIARKGIGGLNKMKNKVFEIWQ